MNTPTFVKELERLLNKHGMGSKAETPDYILAGYLNGCLHGYIDCVRFVVARKQLELLPKE